MLARLLIIVLFPVTLFLMVQIPTSYAIGKCNNPIANTVPDPLFENSLDARFIVDVGKNKQSNISGWKIEFQCGTRQDQKDALFVPDSESKIYIDISNSGTLMNRCEFDPKNSPVPIKVKAQVGNNDVDYCEASYVVHDSIKYCTLDIQPDKEIIIGTPITVSGKNLSKDVQYVLKLDDQEQAAGPRSAINAPSFDYPLDISKLSYGLHQVTLHRIIYDTLGPFAWKYHHGPPLCEVIFNVGDDTQPGVKISQDNQLTKGLGGIITSAAGIACDTHDGGPVRDDTPDHRIGIMTAIGCVPTEPVELVKGLFRLALGVSGGIALLLMIFGGFLMITSAGNPD
ncbi:hypothetical protein C4544_03580, partial [candidate division WS5 bacterium]